MSDTPQLHHEPHPPHAHANEHGHDHAHGHSYADEARPGLRALLVDSVSHLFGLHTHDHGTRYDSVLESSARGIWALKVSLVGLMVTAVFQVAIVAVSGSVALLADTIHNFSDALTAIPLWIAFALNRRAASRRYTYGYGRAEDLAGVLIVLMIFASALVVIYESVQKIIRPEPMQHLEWVAIASVIGFLGNEAVAVFRLRVGREIGSAALIADGMHARVDGITSLGVLAGVLGVWLGFWWADPLMGFIIGFAILVIVRDAARAMWYRLMDAAEPELIHGIEHASGHVAGVQGVHDVRARWIGHRLRAEMHITVDCDLPLAQAHAIAEEVRHTLLHEFHTLSDATIHLDPCDHDGSNHHLLIAHHQPQQPTTAG